MKGMKKMKNLMIFENKQVEVFELNGQVLFNPKHVSECLDIVDVNSSIRNFNEKQVIKLTNLDMHNMHIRKLNNAGENFLTESGVYKLIFKSKKEEAEKFQDWVTDEVLPSIRKTGGYIPTDENMSDSEIMARALQISQKTIEEKNNALREEKYKNIVLEQEKEENKSKVLFSEAVENSNDLVLVKEMATIITQSGFKIGQNELFEYLRRSSYLCSKKGGLYNLPTKKYEHLFKVTKSNIQRTNIIEVKNTTKINGKGQLYFARKFAEYKLKGLTTKDLLKDHKEAM